nr:ORF72 [Human gammaherpesvirus 8]
MATANNPPSGLLDPTLCEDRIFYNILEIEPRFLTSDSVFGTFQQSLTSHMRKLLGTWMFSVCQEYNLEPNVVALALNLLDRLLFIKQVSKEHFQKTGSACLLVASKLRSLTPISTSSLCYAAADSFSRQELIDQEKELLEKLAWRTEAVLATDVTSFLLLKLLGGSQHLDFWHHEVNTLITKALVDPKTGSLPASIISAAGCALLVPANVIPQDTHSGGVVPQLASILGCDVSVLQAAVEQILTSVSDFDLRILDSY